MIHLRGKAESLLSSKRKSGCTHAAHDILAKLQLLPGLQKLKCVHAWQQAFLLSMPSPKKGEKLSVMVRQTDSGDDGVAVVSEKVEGG